MSVTAATFVILGRLRRSSNGLLLRVIAAASTRVAADRVRHATPHHRAQPTPASRLCLGGRAGLVMSGHQE
jgi:hypothetical protein